MKASSNKEIRQSRPHGSALSAFTLIELLAIIAMIAILAGILVPVVNKSRTTALKSACLSNVRQIAIAANLQVFDDPELKFVNRGTSFNNYGEVADSLLPYVGEAHEIFDCPVHPGWTWGRMKISSLDDVFSEYEFNGQLANFGTKNDRRYSQVHTPSLAALVYDIPHTVDDGRHHKDGINIGYLDGHASWVDDADLGLGSEGSGKTFYERGHDFWK